MILDFGFCTLPSTGPNLGKLAVWTRTINRQDQLVIQPRSLPLHLLVEKQISRGSTLNETKKYSKKTSCTISRFKIKNCLTKVWFVALQNQLVLNQTIKGDDPSVAASQWARTKLAVWASSSHH